MNASDPERARRIQLVVGDDAPDLSLSDHEGHVIALASLWKSQPRVLLFVRHFG
jgi:peroxiredoxin